MLCSISASLVVCSLGSWNSCIIKAGSSHGSPLYPTLTKQHCSTYGLSEEGGMRGGNEAVTESPEQRCGWILYIWRLLPVISIGPGAGEVMKIKTCRFHCHSATFLPLITDKCLWENLIEAAMFSPILFAKETLGMSCYWAFSDCWHTHLAIGWCRDSEGNRKQAAWPAPSNRTWEECFLENVQIVCAFSPNLILESFFFNDLLSHLLP